MKYLNFVGADALPAPEPLAIMQREIPRWAQEMEASGVPMIGRPLDVPETAVTVRVHDGETLLTDGPFVEAKEFIAGFNLIECADLDEAIAVDAKDPVSWFMSIEIRTFASGPLLGEKAPAFGRFEDGTGTPYALIMWAGGNRALPPADQALMARVETWRQDLATRGLLILGGTLEGADTATTLRVRDGNTRLADGPFLKTGEYITAIDVVSCPDRQQAVELAVTHPAARSHGIEVRPFENM